MPTTITQSENESDGRTYLRVEGDMLLEDAVLVERIARQLNDESGTAVTIDLADLAFLDSDSAAILKRLSDEQSFEITGMEIFLQSIVNQVEHR